MSDRLRLAAYIPELDGLRGLAIGSVLLYHCHEKLRSSHLDVVTQWGWVGVNLFFVLSGFLITGIILDARDDPNFFRNFYARRGLRIWPVYVLVLLLNYFAIPVVFGSFWWAIHEMRYAPWLHYIFFVQNLFFLTLPGTIGPTWSLAIEEQYYIFWAPIARFLKNAFLLPFLILVFVASPFIRLANTGFLTSTHTLTHLDGLAIGSLISLLLRAVDLSRSTWSKFATAGLLFGLSGVVLMIFHGSAFTDTLLALGFAGMLVKALLVSDSSHWYAILLRIRPLKFLGMISYGLYMIHILCFVVIGAFDLRMEKYGARGDIAVVLVRLALSISAATALWYGFEKPILRLKRYFVPEKKRPVDAVDVVLVPAD
jgi:peptidoglycan/LPS O-acetylase OafA/YrhL